MPKYFQWTDEEYTALQTWRALVDSRLGKLETAPPPVVPPVVPPPTPPVPVPVGTLPGPQLDTTHPQWVAYTTRIGQALIGKPQYGSGLTDWLYYWSAVSDSWATKVEVTKPDGTRETLEFTRSSLAGIALAAFRKQLAAKMVQWNAGQRFDGWEPPFAIDSYLYIGDTVRDWCLVLNWLGSSLTEQERTDAGMILEQAVFNVHNPAAAEWGGVSYPAPGWALTNPGDNYYYSFFEATYHWAVHSQSATWLAKLTAMCDALEAYHADKVGGGSLEGTGYGQTHRRLFQVAWMVQQATGRALNLRVPETLRYWYHATTSDWKSFAPLGDQSRVSYPVIWDYVRALILWGVRLVPTTPEAAMARHWLTRAGRNVESGFNYWNCLISSAGTETPDTATSYFAPAAGHFFATDGTVDIAVAGGPALQGHDHEDQGAVDLYSGTVWGMATANIWTHSGIRFQVGLHNIVAFKKPDGSIVPQWKWAVDAFCPMTATDDGNLAVVTVDTRPAYKKDAAIQNSAVRVEWDRAAKTLRTVDTFTLTDRTAEWRRTVAYPPTIQPDGTVKAGPLTFRCLTPGCTATVADWNSIDTDINAPGKAWLVAFNGGTTGYEVEVTY